MTDTYGIDLYTRNDALLRMLGRLRQHIDINRMVSLNATHPRVGDLEIGPFMEYVQNTSLQMIAMQICKIYEPTNKRFRLNSIPAIAAALDQLAFEQTAASELDAFGKVYAPHLEAIPTAKYVKNICDHMLSKNAVELDRLKEFRDKVGAHSEAGISIHNLPSHDVFERLFKFGIEFYRVVRRTLQDVGPYTVGHHVNPAFVRLLKAAGLTYPKLRFEE